MSSSTAAASNAAATTVDKVVTTYAVQQKLIDGTMLLLVYYVLIFGLFISELIIAYNHQYKKKNPDKTQKSSGIHKLFSGIYTFYRKNSLVFLNLVMYAICMTAIIINKTDTWRVFIGVTGSFIIFTIIMRVFLRLFLGKNEYENMLVTRTVNLIFYILLGNFFCFFLSFVSKPDLFVCYGGLLFGLYLCYTLMLRAIMNPWILQKNLKSNKLVYKEAFGIIKGMLAVFTCELAILYMMVYSCWVTYPQLYVSSTHTVLNAWDMVYYLFVSFCTIGYGDIVPLRVGMLFYSEFTAIVIGITSLFTTACFAAAVISSANNIASNTRQNLLDEAAKTGESLPKTLRDAQIADSSITDSTIQDSKIEDSQIDNSQIEDSGILGDIIPKNILKPLEHRDKPSDQPKTVPQGEHEAPVKPSAAPLADDHENNQGDDKA